MMFSLLMSLYEGESASNLDQALQSVAASTVLPTEVVMVLDGPVRAELKDVIEKHAAGLNLKIVALSSNVGLGKALSEGLRHCSYDWIARFDTDDLNEPHRFEVQLELIEKFPAVDVFGSSVVEFVEEPDVVRAIKNVPETHDAILKFAKKRNPFNHMTVMFRKETVLRFGGYGNEYFYEDYALWVRMLAGGAQAANIREPLVRMRTAANMYKRRGGLRYARQELAVQYSFFKLGFIGPGRMLLNCLQRIPTRLLPAALREFVYLKFLR
ncbi:glycosyltransferase [Pusillimonas sp. ANT_WB101]|uniref:glycosyltransferase n=1 Tax=Pusillimonas sp. ANT_WB101 TaxID=2597356 RepID=UPI0011EDDA4B|nr:glycosyltransferase [Pusillimonas sp. ANT_WB101]KAA0889511.1 glycosyltransferase [Pusillimonas sp. ANT_WB101]